MQGPNRTLHACMYQYEHTIFSIKSYDRSAAVPHVNVELSGHSPSFSLKSSALSGIA